MSFFQNKIVAVTGGSEGIGKALVEALIARGAKVATCGRNYDKLYSLQMKYPTVMLHTITCDVSKEQECQRFIDSTIRTFGGLDILINNAGISMRSLFEDLDLEAMHRIMDVNFWGAVYCTKHALPSIIERKGMVVGISSVAGYRGLPGRSGYSASKFALQGWLETLRTELLHRGVHVMWVSPGFIRSNIRQAALNKDGEQHATRVLDESKLMAPEECALLTLDAMEEKKRTLVMTFQGKRAVLINKLFPGLADKLAHRYYFKQGKLVK